MKRAASELDDDDDKEEDNEDEDDDALGKDEAGDEDDDRTDLLFGSTSLCVPFSPQTGSTTRNKATAREDLPDPEKRERSRERRHGSKKTESTKKRKK